jgi:4-hydroxybenzoate polyprenyltransferase
MAQDPAADRSVPLCIDCDGTLVRTDLFHEALLRVLKRRPLLIFSMIGWLLAGKAVFKAKVAALAPLQPANLPVREEVMALIAGAREEGRPIVLATAAHRDHADVLAGHLGVFDHVVATEGGGNMAARAKATALTDRYGVQGFDYVGDSHADLPVWAQARRAYVVGRRGGVARAIGRNGLKVERLDGEGGGGARALLKALRLHQWLKNLLVFLPPAAGHAFALPTLVNAFFAFVAFSLCASAVYVLNDMLDVDADRAHARKRRRPFAAGTLQLKTGLLVSPLMFVTAILMAYLITPLFLAVLLIYAVLTTAYSVRLKQQVIVDVMLLGVLYTTRIVGGSAATGVVPSFWLLAFSMFLFFSLALVKRYSELLPLAGDQRMLVGRGYRSADLPVLMAIGVASGMAAVLVLAFYVDAPATRAMYPSAVVILLAPALILYWISRLWMKAHRGEVHDDPVIFAARDWQTLVIVAMLGLLFLVAGSKLLIGAAA